jgi:hypothetical protein
MQNCSAIFVNKIIHFLFDYTTRRGGELFQIVCVQRLASYRAPSMRPAAIEGRLNKNGESSTVHWLLSEKFADDFAWGGDDGWREVKRFQH